MPEQPHVTPDPMMEELTAIKEAIYEEVKDLSPQERLRWYQEKAQEIALQAGQRLVPDQSRPGIMHLVPLNQDES